LKQMKLKRHDNVIVLSYQNKEIF